MTVTGPANDVRRLRDAARRRIPAHRAEVFGGRQVAWSFEKLFRRHPELRSKRGEPPRDDWHYFADASRIGLWNGASRFRFFLEVKNVQIHKLLRPLSKLYPSVSFVAAELCLDDGSFTSRFIRQGRVSAWEMPESRMETHWRTAANDFEIEDLEMAYEDDTVRDQAEAEMFEEALAHWDGKMRDALRV